jgi:conjugal transfer/entry exclusion protein
MEIKNSITARKTAKLEDNNGLRMVEPGYIRAKDRIENMLFAGERLLAARASYYDFEGDKIDDNIDIRTRSKSYDMAEATQDMLEVQSNIEEKKKVRQEKKKNEKKVDESIDDNNKDSSKSATE